MENKTLHCKCGGEYVLIALYRGVHLDLPNRHACAWYRCNKCEKCSPEAWGSTDEETEKAAYEAAVEWLQKEGAEDGK